MKQYFLIFWDSLDSVSEKSYFFAKDIFYPICKEVILLVKEEKQLISEVNSPHLFSQLAFQSRVISKNS